MRERDCGRRRSRPRTSSRARGSPASCACSGLSGCGRTVPQRSARPFATVISLRVASFFEFAEEEYERGKHQRGMLRSALGYCVRQKNALMRFLDDGRLEMTNNHSERQLRRVAVGRKAWLFVGSDDHGQATGNSLTLIASARLHGLDPEVYLRDLFRVLPHWPRERHLELAPRYWRITRARLDPDELDRELGLLTIPEPPLPTAVPASLPVELRPAP